MDFLLDMKEEEEGEEERGGGNNGRRGRDVENGVAMATTGMLGVQCVCVCVCVLADQVFHISEL